MSRLAPRTVGAFDLVEEVGRGGMGVVVRGRHRRSGADVAVKLLTVGDARRASYRTLFRSEVRAVAGLSHPHVVRVFDHGELDAPLRLSADLPLDAGTPYLVMEWADDGTLQDRGRARRWDELREDLERLLTGLAHVHAHDVVHRDLKPANVLRFSDGGLKLADFGIAHLGGGAKHAVYGTPSFMAPEQVEGRGRDQGPWTDLYALGCLVYALARGASPFFYPGRTSREISAAQIVEQPPPLRAPFAVPRGLAAWTAKLLHKSPFERFRCAADALHRLRELDPKGGAAVSPEAELIEPPTTSEIATVAESSLAPAAPLDAVEVPQLDRPPIPERWGTDDDVPPMDLSDAGLGLFGLRPIPMVGRVAERDALWQALLEVDRTSEPRCVTLMGAAGSGKSRLAEWLATRARELGAADPILVTHSPEAGPRDGLGAALRRRVGAVDAPSAEAVVRLIEHNKVLGETEPEQWYALAPIVAPDLRGRSERAGGAEERFLALARYFRRLGRGRPALLILDDAQWGLDGVELARSLLAAEAPLRLLIVLTVREDALAARPRERAAIESLSSGARARSLEVTALSDDEHERLVRRLLGLSPRVAARVSQRTAGNPLFAVQLVGDWVARGLLAPGDEGFVVAGDAAVELPDDLHALWSARVDRVLVDRPEEQRVALELAATLGLSVGREEWAAVCREVGTEAPMDLVERLIVERLARADLAGLRSGWSFVHAMLRESISRRADESGRARTHHGACARMLIARGGRGTAARLAQHLAAAGRTEESLAAFRDGIRERLASGRYAAASALLGEHDEALLGLGLAPGDPRVALRCSLAARIARAEARYQDALSTCERALDALGEPVTESASAATAELLIERARSAIFVSGIEAARGLVSRAETIARRIDRKDLLAAALQLSSQAALVSGDVERSLSEARSALSLFESMGDDVATTRTLLSLSNCEKIAGQLAPAAEHAERARVTAQRVGWRRGLATALTLLGEIARRHGSLRDAERHLRQAAAVQSASRGEGAVFAKMNLGTVLSERGRDAEARRLLEESLGALSARGMLPLSMGAHVFLLPVTAALGDWEAFDRHLAAAAHLARTHPLIDPDLAEAARRAGRTARDAGELERARGAWQIARDQRVALGEAEVAEEISRALDALDDAATGRD